ncbi:hypothetical protein LGN19_04115 [Burkholderia sp. AU30198]|uniref:hypothetical protein n=1 Tax=Burkholderia sp. AU30198 TaxID=2879627 RepID=UPI001CF2F2B2|nr:hypothetical protein [Burkholderia sp. AU30198]MCA8292970.1 hypothetical protein [Burkholderia sp. AU30198]
MQPPRSGLRVPSPDGVTSRSAVFLRPARRFRFRHRPDLFPGGDSTTGQAVTIVDADWLNQVQETLISILTAVGVAHGQATCNQVSRVLNTLFASARWNHDGRFQVERASHGDSSNNAASTAYVRGVLGNDVGFFPYNSAFRQLMASPIRRSDLVLRIAPGVVTLPQGTSIQAPSVRIVIYNGSLANPAVDVFAGDVWHGRV